MTAGLRFPSTSVPEDRHRWLPNRKGTDYPLWSPKHRGTEFAEQKLAPPLRDLCAFVFYFFGTRYDRPQKAPVFDPYAQGLPSILSGPLKATWSGRVGRSCDLVDKNCRASEANQRDHHGSGQQQRPDQSQ